MRCPRCGNENPATNRFCGMCGTSLLQVVPPAQAGAAAKPAATAPAVEPAASAPQPAVPASRPGAEPEDEAPIISGPSFLGLNEPAPASRRKGALSIDPHSGPSSSNLDYLLEDEEEPKRGGAWKIFLIVFVLAVAAGFGYWRWKGHALPGLTSSAQKPSATAQSSSATGADTTAPSSTAASSTASPPEAAPASQPSPNATDSGGASPSTAPAVASPASGGGQPSPATDANRGPGSTATPPTTPKNADAAPSATPPTRAQAKPASVKTPASPPPQAADSIARAQRYIYGRGVPQNCDRGLRILKPAVDQGNPKAMIEMGALYSAGLCTPRDLPTAYRWFALALRKDPNNVSLQADLNKLWGEMTQPEHELAIKLTQ